MLWGNDELSRTVYKHIPRYIFCDLLKAQLESLSNNDGDGYENVTETVNCTTSNFITLNPSPLIRQILANFVEVEFQTTA